MPAASLRVPSSTKSPCLFTFMVVAVNVAIQPSSHIYPMDISAPDWRWGNMSDVLALLDKKGLMLSSGLLT